MKRSTVVITLPLLAAGAVALSGCSQNASHPFHISYRPVGICRAYETPDGRISAGTSKGFAVFKIGSVDNTEGDDGVIFAVERLFVNQSPPRIVAGSLNRHFVHADPRFARALGFLPIPEIPLAKGERRDVNSIVFIPVNLTDPAGGASANQLSLELAYDTGYGDKGDQENVNKGVSFTITGPAGPKWEVVENCAELTFE